MALLFDQYPSALSQQAALQHQQALVPRNQTRQSQSPSMPNMPTGLLDQFMGGGATGVGSAAGTSSGGVGFGLGQPLVAGEVGGASYAGASGGAAAGGSAAGGGMSAIGSAGPWAALAALVLGNESYQRKKGNREEDTGKYAFDLLTGNKIVERDADTLGEKIDSGNKLGLKGDWQLAGDITSFDFSNAFKNLDDTVVGKLFGGIF